MAAKRKQSGANAAAADAARGEKTPSAAKKPKTAGKPASEPKTANCGAATAAEKTAAKNAAKRAAGGAAFGGNPQKKPAGKAAAAKTTDAKRETAASKLAAASGKPAAKPAAKRTATKAQQSKTQPPKTRPSAAKTKHSTAKAKQSTAAPVPSGHTASSPRAAANRPRTERSPIAQALWRLLAAGFAAAALCAALLAAGRQQQPPLLTACEILQVSAEQETVTVQLRGESRQLFSDALWFCLAPTAAPPDAQSALWQRSENGAAQFTLPVGVYHPFVRDAAGNVSAAAPSVGNRVLAVELNLPQPYYLPVGGSLTLQPELLVMGDADTELFYETEHPELLGVSQGHVTALAPGESRVTVRSADGASAELTVLVSDLYTTPNPNTNQKPMLRADRFTDEEAALLDDILAQQVQLAGEGTRAGAVAAARFLALQFPCRVPYFFENGRMSPHPGRPVADGEGRYYHKGLYLSEEKYQSLSVIRFGPATWGEPLINWEEKYHFLRGEFYPNGLDCSGFVSWALLNGGSDVGDMGAGAASDRTGNNLCELGELVPVTRELMCSDRIKAGDLIGADGHIAMIIGLTEDRVYIAESLVTSVRVSSRRRTAVWSPELYEHVVLMDSVYEGDGNYTAHWA